MTSEDREKIIPRISIMELSTQEIRLMKLSIYGVAAMLLEWGIVKKHLPVIDGLDIKIFMIRGARRDVEKQYPNRDWGYGILDVYNIFDSLRREL